MEEHRKSFFELGAARLRAMIRRDMEEVDRLEKIIDKKRADEKGLSTKNPTHHKKVQDDVYLVEDQEVEE